MKQLNNLPPRSKDLHFPTRFARNAWGQFKSCLETAFVLLEKPFIQFIAYHAHSYSFFTFSCTFLGPWTEIKYPAGLFQYSWFDIHGCGILGNKQLFSSYTKCGVGENCYVSRRICWNALSMGLCTCVTVEIPYLLIQALSYVIIGYPIIGYYWSAYKVFWNFYAMFCTMMFYNFLGMLLVSLTPNSMIASILSSVCYTLFKLFFWIFDSWSENSEVVDLNVLFDAYLLGTKLYGYFAIWRY